MRKPCANIAPTVHRRALLCVQARVWDGRRDCCDSARVNGRENEA